MATRPVFVPDLDGSVAARDVEFTWHAGMSIAQKRRSIESLHEAAAAQGIKGILEVSTKSRDALGVSLSAMNLLLELQGVGRVPVECAFQGSKVFGQGGPFTDLYSASSREAKRDERLRSSGRLVAFRLPDGEWPLEPKTAFYDWLYLIALLQNPQLAVQLSAHDAFTDIEFNPAKSLNTQAHACALYVALSRSGSLDEAVRDKASFLRACGSTSTHGTREPGLFDLARPGRRQRGEQRPRRD